MNLDDYDTIDELSAPPRKNIPAADRELLELAARALGARFEEVDGEGYGNLHFEDGSVVNAWNPLLFGDDTFNLAVRLGLDLSTSTCEAGKFTGDGNEWNVIEQDQGDPMAANKRAVTRAAAEIGKTR